MPCYFTAQKVPSAEIIEVEPASIDDWEVLEQHTGNN